ncbi:MAG TPA: polysaccharide deacetylase family protein [Actinomycetes bacterium]
MGVVAAATIFGGPMLFRSLPSVGGSLLSAVIPSVVWHVRTKRQLVALTFDDGPDEHITPGLLDALGRNGARATFFVIGERVPGNEAMVRTIIAAGHELGNHLMTEEASIGQSTDRFEDQLLAADAILRRFGPIRYFRPASGWFTPAMLRQAKVHGYRCVLGTVTTFHSRVLNPQRTARRLLRWIAPGSIVILHEGKAERRGVIALTEAILSDLTRRGYTAVTLSDLLAATRPSNR